MTGKHFYENAHLMCCIFGIRQRLYGILQTVRQQLTARDSVDGNSALSVASSQKYKVASEEPETHKQLGSDSRQMTQFIQGLVTIATVEILYR